MEQNSVKYRLTNYLEYKGISKSEFGRTIGVSSAYITSMRKSIQPDKLKNIQECYPDLNTNWLLTGVGEMISKDFTSEERVKFDAEIASENVMFVPLVHIDSVGGMLSPNSISSTEQYVERLIPFPDARPGDVAILQSGNSMSPTIPAGAIMQIRRVDGWQEYFGYGNDFVLWLTDERRITKQVLKFEPDPQKYVICHSYNPESADEELPKAMIKEVWKVINVLINKGW